MDGLTAFPHCSQCLSLGQEPSVGCLNPRSAQEQEGLAGIGLFQGTTTCTQEISEGTDRDITRNAVSFPEMENKAPTMPCFEEEVGPGDLQSPLQ